MELLSSFATLLELDFNTLHFLLFYRCPAYKINYQVFTAFRINKNISSL